MRISKLYLPVITAAGALALAGCGGGSSTTGTGSGGAVTRAIPAGESYIVGDMIYTCGGTSACQITITGTGVTPGTGVTAGDAPAGGLTKTQCGEGRKPNDAKTFCVDDPEDKTAEEMTKAAKDLMAALTTGQGPGTPFALTATGLTVDRGDVNDDDPDPITLREDSSATVAALGDWGGSKYAGKDGTGDSAQSAEAVIYTSQGTADPISFAVFAAQDDNGLGTLNGDGAYPITASQAVEYVAGGAFPTRGTEEYTTEAERTFDGTYNGVSGEYSCSTSCTAAFRENGILLSSNWTFEPVAGATVQQEEDEYLYFGWWVRKNSDDEPTNVGTVYGVEGLESGELTAAQVTVADDINDVSLIGDATYTGGAAGKYAVSNPLNAADDNHGHFTANAMLKADFKATGSTLEGTIDGFRLNDGTSDPGWTVTLKETTAVTDVSGIGVWDGSVANAGTEWQIGTSIKGAAGGDWYATMYEDDETSNNVPDAVIGSFHSAIGSTHQMRGAFGAELD